MRVRHKVAKSVWKLADSPTDTAVACLVEGLQTPKDSASLRRMATAAELSIQCFDHTQMVGYIPDNAEKPCEMCNAHATSAIESQVLAFLNESQENGRRNRCPNRCMCNQTGGKYFVGKGTHSKHPLAVLAHEVHKHDGCCTSEKQETHDSLQIWIVQPFLDAQWRLHLLHM